MNKIYPTKLKPGDEIRVIAPSRSLSFISPELRGIANKRFKSLGLNLSFGQHVEERDMFNSSSIESRVTDIHDAFRDLNVKGILTVIGGFNFNQLLKYLDWELIKNNPKVFCGYSDITVFNNAILAKTGMVTYSGPHYSTFGQELHFDYSLEYFQKCLMSDNQFEILPSKQWSDDKWFVDQKNRKLVDNTGWLAISKGEARGRIVGGNLCTLNLLQGTEYFPDLKDSILFLEDDSVSQPHDFDRDLQSLIHQPGFSQVKGVVIGRFQNESGMSAEKLLQIVTTKQELRNIPVIAGMDFGHTDPKITFPVGGEAKIIVDPQKSGIQILKH